MEVRVTVLLLLVALASAQDLPPMGPLEPAGAALALPEGVGFTPTPASETWNLENLPPPPKRALRLPPAVSALLLAGGFVGGAALVKATTAAPYDFGAR